VLQFVAFVTNAHRYAVGMEGAWLPPWNSRWSPEGGLVLWTALAGMGCLMLAVAPLLVTAEEEVPTGRTVDRFVDVHQPQLR
jgi:hypothetical protein